MQASEALMKNTKDHVIKTADEIRSLVGQLQPQNQAILLNIINAILLQQKVLYQRENQQALTPAQSTF